jgi:hypothetical protein
MFCKATNFTIERIIFRKIKYEFKYLVGRMSHAFIFLSVENGFVRTQKNRDHFLNDLHQFSHW